MTSYNASGIFEYFLNFAVYFCTLTVIISCRLMKSVSLLSIPYCNTDNINIFQSQRITQDCYYLEQAYSN